MHVPGISQALERSLWDRGVLTWDDYLGGADRLALPVDARRVLKNSVKRLEARDHQYFRNKLPSREHWRTFPEFSDRLVYLDIETDGGFGGDSITMVGVYDGKKYRAYIKGKDLDSFPHYMMDKGLMVTFFGSGFDVPLLKKLFPYLSFNQLHIDLCHSLRRLGLRGGLKQIERQLGISRSDETDGLSGRDAITLWRNYRRGEEKALDLLIQYNREDVINLGMLLAHAYEGLREGTFGEFDQR